MRFDSFVEELGRIELGDATHLPSRDMVREAVRLLGGAVVDSEFIMDCCEKRLRLAANRASGELTPLWSGPGFWIELGIWTPGVVMVPHEHKHWTVTALLSNRLTMTTFEPDAAKDGVLKRRNEFPVFAGQAGHIYEYGVHQPANPTDTVSVSFHIFSRGDSGRTATDLGLVAESGAMLAPVEGDPDLGVNGFVRCVSEAQAISHEFGKLPVPAQWAIRGACAVLAAVPDARAASLLGLAFDLGDIESRYQIARHLHARDKAAGERLLERVAAAERAAEELRADRDWLDDVRREHEALRQPDAKGEP